jgi:hypothetical protein
VIRDVPQVTERQREYLLLCQSLSLNEQLKQVAVTRIGQHQHDLKLSNYNTHADPHTLSFYKEKA